MAAFARDIMQFKYYMEGAHSEDTAELEKHLVAEKARIPSRIP